MKRYQNQRGQEAGALHDDGIFRKKVSAETHLYKNQNAWGMDKSILLDLPEGTEIRIKDLDDETVYVTTKERFLTGFEADWGHGQQILFWRGMFDQIKDGESIPSPYIKDWDASMELWNSYD